MCWRCRCRWFWLVEWNAATAPIGWRAWLEVRSIAWLEPPVPGRASYGKLLRLCIVRSCTETANRVPTLLFAVRSSRFFLPVSAFFLWTRWSTRLVLFFTPSYILVSLTVAPESSLRRRCFFPAVKSTTWLYESSDRRRVSLRAFIVTELFCVPRAFVYPVPFLLLFKDFSSTFCEIDSTGDCLFSIELIVPGKCFFFFFFSILNSFPYCHFVDHSSFTTFFFRFLFTFCIVSLEFIAYSYDDERLFIAVTEQKRSKNIKYLSILACYSIMNDRLMFTFSKSYYVIDMRGQVTWIFRYSYIHDSYLLTRKYYTFLKNHERLILRIRRKICTQRSRKYLSTSKAFHSRRFSTSLPLPRWHLSCFIQYLTFPSYDSYTRILLDD